MQPFPFPIWYHHLGAQVWVFNTSAQKQSYFIAVLHAHTVMRKCYGKEPDIPGPTPERYGLQGHPCLVMCTVTENKLQHFDWRVSQTFTKTIIFQCFPIIMSVCGNASTFLSKVEIARGWKFPLLHNSAYRGVTHWGLGPGICKSDETRPHFLPCEVSGPLF